MTSIKKLFTSGLTLATLALATAGLSTAHADKDTYLIGTESGYAPYEYLDKDGKIVGLDIDLINKICDMWQAKCEIKDSAFDSLIPSLKAKKFDIVIAGINPTAERRKVVAFTQPYVDEFTFSYVVTDNSKITNLDQVKKVGYLAGTVAQQYLSEKTKFDPVSYATFDLAFTDLKTGRVDAILIATDSGSTWAAQPDYKFLVEKFYDPILGESPAILVNKKNTELLDKLNKALDELKANGELDKLQIKYGLKQPS